MSKKSPQLRFEGFTDDWEERKLGDIFSERSERSGEGELISVTINSGIIRASELNRTDNSSDDKSNYKKVEVGDIAYNSMRMWQGASGYSPYEGILSPAYTVIFPKEGIDSKFFSYDFKRYDMIQTFKRNSQGLTSDTWNLKFPTLKSVKVMVPCFEEQKQISNFFESVDKTIALHQRKLDLLKEQKKGYLQKMFPKNGEKVPELRFAGFADDWEERKVGNFLSESKIKGSDGSVSKKLTVKLWRKGIVPKEEIYKGSSATQYYIRLAGQFMYGKLDFLNQAFGILPNELDGYESTLDSPAFDFKDGINPNFFLEYVCQENFYKYQGNIANGSRKAKRIHADTFFDMPITIPSFEEQEKIGNFFKELDDAIALHQRKLDLLKEQKKGFLQKMFV